MIGRLLGRTGEPSAESVAPRQFYECTYCQRDTDEWVEDCPRCGQLVVRIVEPPG